MGNKALPLTEKETISCQEDGASEKEKEGKIESVFSGMRLPVKLHKEILSYGVKCAIDCTPGQGEMLKACVDLRIPVLALCLTEKHAEALEERLTHYCLEKFQDNTHTLFRADCKFEKKIDKDPDENPDPKPPPPIDQTVPNQGERIRTRMSPPSLVKRTRKRSPKRIRRRRTRTRHQKTEARRRRIRSHPAPAQRPGEQAACAGWQ